MPGGKCIEEMQWDEEEDGVCETCRTPLDTTGRCPHELHEDEGPSDAWRQVRVDQKSKDVPRAQAARSE